MLVFAGVISMQQETRKAIPEPKHPWLQVDYGHEEAWIFAAKKVGTTPWYFPERPETLKS